MKIILRLGEIDKIFFKFLQSLLCLGLVTLLHIYSLCFLQASCEKI